MNEAKQKAQELTNSFYQPLGYMSIDESSNRMWEHAKQCALICCDEIIEAVKVTQAEIEEYWEFWQSVKEQVNLL